MTLDPTKIYKVFHSLWYDEKSTIHVTELQWEDDVWYLVFQWTERSEGRYPSIRHAITTSRLVSAPSQNRDFLINDPVEIPTSKQMTDLLGQVVNQDK